MSLSSVAVRAGELSRPFGAYLELTYSCNWRCVFCYNPRHHDVRRLDVTEWISVLDSLRSIGVLQLTLTGGEPLAHPEFFEIAESARERAFAIRVFTNGAMADSPETVRRLAALQPYCVEISLHGATADVHDTTTMRPGSFAQMWRAIDRLVEANVRLNLKAPVTSINEHQLDAMIELAASRGLPLRLDASLTPRDDGDLAPQRFSASGEVKTRILELGVNSGNMREVTRNAGDSNCGIGRSSLAIDPEGNVYPCMQWRQTSLGNVRQEPLDTLWRSSHERARVVKMAIDVNDRLREERPDSSALPFCPALAAQRTGDPLALDDEYRDASLSLISLLRERNAAR